MTYASDPVAVLANAVAFVFLMSASMSKLSDDTIS